jgi:multidrug transporter EmrE-like cation transporter
MVIVCTILAAVAQVFLKYGTQHPLPPVALGDPSTWMPFIGGLVTDAPLIIGYTLHGGNAALLILALREGQLSVLYPIYALSYVWVNMLSMYFFGEMLNLWKTVGIVLVIAGVAMIGRVTEHQ